MGTCHPEHEPITLKRENDGRHVQQGDPSERGGGQGEQEGEEEGQGGGDQQVNNISTITIAVNI